MSILISTFATIVLTRYLITSYLLLVFKQSLWSDGEVKCILYYHVLSSRETLTQMGYLDRCITKYVLLPSDSVLQRKRKKTVTYVCVGLMLLTFVTFWSTDYLMKGITVFSAMLNIVLLGRTVVLKKDVTDNILLSFSITCAVLICLTDLYAVATGLVPAWPSFILFLDLQLVCETDRRSSTILVSVALIYLLFVALESHFRFGALEYPLSPSREDRTWMVQCSNPPCSLPLTVCASAFLFQATVFYLDYIITRKFAETVRAEKKSMVSCITAAQKIASSLAAFDLASAEQSLSQSDIPVDLREALTTLLTNLDNYKSYLPRSCLPCTDEIGQSTMSTIEASVITREIQKKKITLLESNLGGGSLLLCENALRYANCVADYISALNDVANTNRGIIEKFHGDCVLASFGASRYNTLHSISACEAASKFSSVLTEGFWREYGLRSYIGISCGVAHCGDLGCSYLLSYSIIGSIIKWVRVVRKHSQALGVSILVDNRIMNEVKCTIPLRIVDLLTDSIGAVKLLYELDFPSQSYSRSKESVGNEEWMYQLAAMRADRWDAYNTAATSYLTQSLNDTKLTDFRLLLDRLHPNDVPVYSKLLSVMEDNRTPPLPLVIRR